MTGSATRLAAGALLLGLALPHLGCAERAADRHAPNVLIVLVDTLRKDHLGLYGYGRNTSPNIDALGAAAWVMENHIAPASQTIPSTLSMLLALERTA